VGYYWATTPELETETAEQVGLLVEFDDQGTAEAWLSDAYSELTEAGAHDVCLYEGDRLVYGPMSLSE